VLGCVIDLWRWWVNMVVCVCVCVGANVSMVFIVYVSLAGSACVGLYALVGLAVDVLMVVGEEVVEL
jgi:hypothetical protein